MYDTILAALRDNATADALVAARELVTASPNDPQAHRWLAAALQQDLQTVAALESMDRAIALAPEDAGLHLALAGILVSSSRHDEAQAALAAASRLNPNEFQAYLMQAQLALGRGELEEAERFSRLAARVFPDHPRLAAIDGMVALNRGDSARAMQIVSMAIRQAPEDHQLRHALGFIYMAQQHWAFAEQAFRSVLESNPSTDGLRSLIANLVNRQGRPQDAADELEPLLRKPASSSPALRRYASQLRMAGGQHEEAFDLLRSALRQDPSDSLALQMMVDGWRRLGAHEDARNTLDELLDAASDSADLWYARLGFEALIDGDVRGVSHRWVAAMPRHIPALEAHMQALDVEGSAEAEAIAERIVELEPGRVSGEQKLVDSLLARGEPEAAFGRIHKLIERADYPQSKYSLNAWLGLVQDKAGHHSEALRTWLLLAQQMTSMRLPLQPLAEVDGPWPDLGSVSETSASPFFLWGPPGSGVEAVAGVMNIPNSNFLADRFGSSPPRDGLQNYNTPALLASGVLDGAAVVESWHAAIPVRQARKGNVVDWLLYWDNALLLGLRPHLPAATLLITLRDPRDMLLDWLAFGSVPALAIADIDQAAGWLAKLLGQVADLRDHDYYPHRIIRLDGVVNNPEALSSAVGSALNIRMPPWLPSVQVEGRFAEGHWRNYAEVLKGPFATLSTVAFRLGYPEA